MRKVRECCEKIPELFEVVKEGDFERLRELQREISRLEWEADEIKNDVREHLPRSIFMPVDRADILDVLSAQDAVSDCAEDVADLLTLRPLPFLEGFNPEFEAFLDQVMVCCRLGATITEEMDKLVEASFGGPEAAKVLEMVNELCEEEYKSDRLHRAFIRSGDGPISSGYGNCNEKFPGSSGRPTKLRTMCGSTSHAASSCLSTGPISWTFCRRRMLSQIAQKM